MEQTPRPRKKQKEKKERSRMLRRYLTLSVGFCLILAAFAVVLLTVGLQGGSGIIRQEGYERTYTVPGIRGEIYDCNGTLLVGNSTSYDLIFEYGAMSDTRRDVNLSLLAVLDAIKTTGNQSTLSKDYYVLEGTYPNLKLSATLKDPDSDESYYYGRFLARNELDPDSTAEEITAYLVDRYKLRESLYTNEEITSLMRLYYEMERVDFGAYASYTIAKNVSMDLITALEEKNIEGVNFVINATRVYAYPGVASHILGQLGRIPADDAEYYAELGYAPDARVGLSGCEAAFEAHLRGDDGVMVIRYDEEGNQLEKTYKVEPKSGNDVYLTIDIDLQLAAEQGLAENVDMVEGADAGAITVTDPNTGAVLAIASYPTYDLSKFSSQSYYDSLLSNENLPLLNRALQGVYAPGSTYKIGAALAALETGIIDDTTVYTCTGTYPHRHNPTCLASHGVESVVDAIRDSCNVFFYYLGDAMGIDAMTEYTERLGLGVKTGIELSERQGIVAGPEYRKENGLDAWMEGDNLSAAIGQSDHGYTPLQLSVYLSSVVNGGTRYKTHLLDSVRRFYTGEVLQSTEVTVLDQVEISEENYLLLIESMRRVVASSGNLTTYFQNVPVTVGGKTGTAEVSGKKDYAVYCGFAPLNEPEIVASCIIEEGAVGARAAYAVAKVMEVYFAKQATGTPSEP